jgi:quercetin dioxygenase-like cupin family protein
METIRRVSKPWGFEIWWAVTEQYAGKLLHVEQGHRLSLQYHRHKDESCYLLSGRLRLTKGPSVDELSTQEKRAGDAWRNRPGEIHTLEAVETSRVLEASTPQLDDVVRLLDDYGRVGDAAEHQPDVVAHRGSEQPLRLLDRDLVAAKLRLRRDEVMAVVSDPSFPAPAGYFRGRVLWEEAAVDAWQTPAAVELRTASS